MNIEGREFAPSRFLTDLLGVHITEVDQAKFMEEFNPLTALAPVPRAKVDVAFLRSALEERGWSALHLITIMKVRGSSFIRMFSESRASRLQSYNLVQPCTLCWSELCGIRRHKALRLTTQ